MPLSSKYTMHANSESLCCTPVTTVVLAVCQLHLRRTNCINVKVRNKNATYYPRSQMMTFLISFE